MHPETVINNTVVNMYLYFVYNDILTSSTSLSSGSEEAIILVYISKFTVTTIQNGQIIYVLYYNQQIVLLIYSYKFNCT